MRPARKRRRPARQEAALIQTPPATGANTTALTPEDPQSIETSLQAAPPLLSPTAPHNSPPAPPTDMNPTVAITQRYEVTIEASTSPQPETAVVVGGDIAALPSELQDERLVESTQPASTTPDAAAAQAAESSPHIKPMYIVMLTPELAPVAKVGGLADVVFGLSSELAKTGNTIEIILPKYNNMRYDQIASLHICHQDLWVPWFKGAIHCSVWFGTVHDCKCYFIEAHSNENFFNRNAIYGCSDDIMRFTFFCRAALEFMLKSNKRPEIIHCHDWPTGLAPVLLFEIYKWAGMERTRVCYTIHNFKHQGWFGDQALWATGLGRPDYFYAYDRLRDNNNARSLNMLKSGIVYSNFVTTVSPHYAWEAKNSWMGFGMNPTLNTHHTKFGGIINGLDYDYWNPATDPALAAHYSVADLDTKYTNKAALRRRFKLSDCAKPLIAFVGRLDPQKGLHLVKHALYYSVRANAQFALLGSSPDSRINNEFLAIKRSVNDNPDCHLEIGYNEELAHLIYAGADMILVPSDYEPCGLAQLIALRYGTVPIVREVGGLVDTVFDKDYSDRPQQQRNGYLFRDATTTGIEWALNRAIACYYQYPDHFRHLILNGMAADYSWREPAKHYLNIYDYIRVK
jgi:starch synthase